VVTRVLRLGGVVAGPIAATVMAAIGRAASALPPTRGRQRPASVLRGRGTDDYGWFVRFAFRGTAQAPHRAMY
jgi:crotonobetainyl-CoA:carnitine CoA-transferase CaiB-like acyl-CoA transferase